MTSFSYQDKSTLYCKNTTLPLPSGLDPSPHVPRLSRRAPAVTRVPPSRWRPLRLSEDSAGRLEPGPPAASNRPFLCPPAGRGTAGSRPPLPVPSDRLGPSRPARCRLPPLSRAARVHLVSSGRPLLGAGGHWRSRRRWAVPVTVLASAAVRTAQAGRRKPGRAESACLVVTVVGRWAPAAPATRAPARPQTQPQPSCQTLPG